MLIPRGRLFAGLALVCSTTFAQDPTPITATPAVSVAPSTSTSTETTSSPPPYTFHLAIFTPGVRKSEVTAALALAGQDVSDEQANADLERMAVLRVVPEEDIGSQIAKQLAAARITTRTQHSGSTVGRRGVSTDIILRPRNAADVPVTLAIASFASEAIGDKLQTVIRYRESDSAPTGIKVREQGEIITGLRYGDALVLQLKSGYVMAVAPGQFDAGPEADVAPISTEQMERLKEPNSPAPVIEQGSGATIEWYAPYSNDVPDQSSL